VPRYDHAVPLGQNTFFEALIELALMGLKPKDLKALWGVMTFGEANREAPGSGGASPYLRRGILR
jgi:hypothetical protein